MEIKQGIVVRNIKTDNLYVINGTALNCTNANDGQVMVIYANETQEFVREITEFKEKFEAVIIPEEESRIITLN